MTIGQAIATIFAGFLFPFMIRMIWDHLVDEFRGMGGWISAAFIVGTLWIANHGLENPMITQSGGAWVDMALAGGIGVYVATIARGKEIRGSLTNIAAAVVGSLLGGWLLSLFL